MAASIKICLRTSQSYARSQFLHRCAMVSRNCHSSSKSDDQESSKLCKILDKRSIICAQIAYDRASPLKQMQIKVRHRRVPCVGMSADGSTLIGWHPEPEHPYEHTQPVKYDMKEAEEGTVLKDELVRDYLTRFRPSGPTISELAAITYTTKHQWLPKPEKKYIKRNPPKDRDSI